MAGADADAEGDEAGRAEAESDLGGRQVDSLGEKYRTPAVRWMPLPIELTKVALARTRWGPVSGSR